VLIDCQKSNLPIRLNYELKDFLNFVDKTQISRNDDKVNIYFFGGEPSLEYGLAQQIVDMTTAKFTERYKLSFVLHTNGLALNEIPPDLRNSLSLIMLSINYEAIPKHNLAGSYFQRIIDNAVGIKLEKNIPIIARLTITEKTSIYTQIMQISHFFDLIYWQIENCDALDNFEAFYETYTYEIGLLYNIWLKYFEVGTMLKLVPFMSVVKFMFFHDRPDNEFACGYGRRMVFIQTDGNCYACSDNVEGGIHHMGTLKTGITTTIYKLDKLKCASCSYRPLCMGRCGRIHAEYSGRRIDEYCMINKFMFDLFISDKDRLAKVLQNYAHYRHELSNDLLGYTEFTP
jgi:radical SAM protein with 4Fe4S-binding SPASM domain